MPANHITILMTSPFSSDITINSYSKISGLLSVVDDYSWCHQQILTCLFRRDRHLDKQQLNTKCEAYIKVRKCLEIDPDIRYQCDKNTINNLKTIFNENYPQCQKSYTQALSHSSQRTKPYLNLIYIIVAVVVSISFSY
ncbi:unnamed protein product [Didymodactylos carnosus]|uniref:Uncharacterized protein n=1 Tax=Didymodactylos carnosus TaxID=1234261 RepID=A0A814D2M4_9BILA|nr:unnamed protein product [Didymodactylos carnosus]CAF3723669.1 unnamed protein product [Didymodactylos carnosus]